MIAVRSMLSSILVAFRTHATGLALRGLQTGRLRQYVMFIALGAIVLIFVVGLLRSYTFAQLL